MWQYPLALVCAPLLIWQGRLVRKNTPRLPEPEGERSGECGIGKPLRVLIAGDSAAAGVGVEHQFQALSGHLLQQLQCDYQLSWKLAAKTGFTSQDIRAVLQEMPAEKFDIAFISSGVNDVTKGISCAAFSAQQAQIAGLLRQRFSVQTIIFSALPPMDQFPALPQPLRLLLGWRAKLFDRHLLRWVEKQVDCYYLKGDFPLQPGVMAIDGFHPGPEGYRLWGATAAALIRSLYPVTVSLHRTDSGTESQPASCVAIV